MGLFDRIRCKYSLPVPEAQDECFQTKDLENLLTDFTIREDGTLWRTEYDLKSLPDAQAAKPGSLRSLRATRTNPREIPFPHTGTVIFYGGYVYADPESGNQSEGEVEFEAIFSEGKLTRLTTLHHKIPPIKVARELGQAMDQRLPGGIDQKDGSRGRF